MDKLVNIRRHGQCAKCHRYRELRVGWNDLLTDVIAVCDQCFVLPMDEEAFDLVFEKAGVPMSHRPVQRLVDNARRQVTELTFSIERVFPEDD